MKKIILPLIILSILSACSSDGNNDSDSLVFNVDSTKISSIQLLPDIPFSFHPPLNWNEVEAEISERIVNSLTSQKNNQSLYIYQPSKIFFNKQNSCLLAVGVVETPKAITPGSTHLAEYLKVVDENFKESVSKKGKFTKDGIEINQYLIRKQSLISFKLIFEVGDGMYQFDYSIPMDSYEQELKSLESSIGSIQLTNTGR